MSAVVIGIDIGTSGARAVAMDATSTIVAQSTAPLSDFGDNHLDPDIWWAAAARSIRGCMEAIDGSEVRAMAVDGTSGTVLPVDSTGRPLAAPLMYNDKVADAGLLARIAPLMPPESAAHGPTSGLAKMLVFQLVPGVAKLLHQADWIAGRLSGRFDVTDENNALKSGYDPVAGRWPGWIADTGLKPEFLPEVLAPGAVIGNILGAVADQFGLPSDVRIIAGTTDGCASFLATGASEPGDGVSALGSSLTLKLLSSAPIFAPEFGIYSHHILGVWLAGGASNTGGKVLAHFFDPDSLRRLSAAIDPSRPSGLDYYPLLSPGERFPIMDPSLPPRLEPRPAQESEFLKGLLEGIAAIEQLGYQRLEEFGAPKLKSVRSVGGGSANPHWTSIRRRLLGVPFLAAASGEAAAGAARLALAGAREAGIL
ncbi:FGGY-family carbohydrate kinase [Bradyrhizobium sp. STM 3562]|uniref:FGGY-family carbohydrate kinase n=1 Tax=Bradyrhizobium sp. STM 3562 TaxID=578924 RepID=UPI003890598D